MIVQQLLELCEVAKVVIVDNNELSAYNLSELMQKEIKNKRLVIHLSDYADIDQLRQIIELYKPTSIYHAAAYKHVNLLESINAYSAVHNNCIKSIHLARALRDYKFIMNFVLVSTDKAVKPQNIMGLSKRIVELSLNNIFEESPINLITVRFGNVIGSNGSVFHKFMHQIQNHQKLTLTDLSVTRYFMNIKQAANLIIKASLVGKPGYTYVLNMGKPIKIHSLLINMIEKYGTKKQLNDIVITGLNPGEKKYEELYYKDESFKVYDETMYEGKNKNINFEIEKFEKFFKDNAGTFKYKDIKRYLKSIKIF